MTLPEAFTCPRCKASATPGPGPQRCSSCGGAFALHAGAASDASVVPPAPRHGDERIQVKSAGALTYRFGTVDIQGVSEGMLDPVVALVPVDSQGVAYGDVLSIAVWRTVAWVDLVVAVLIPIPIAALLTLVGWREPVVLAGAALFWALAGLLLWRAFGLRANRARVVGRYRTLQVRFDRPVWRRRKFHDELLRRSGISPQPLP